MVCSMNFQLTSKGSLNNESKKNVLEVDLITYLNVHS